MTTSELIRVAILDDYRQVALKSADWSPLKDRLSIDVFTDTIPNSDEDGLIQRLQPYTIVCAMRERSKFTARVLDALPNLKMIATTGMANASIDVAHAEKKGIVVSGTGNTGNSTLEHIWALILATARGIVHEHNNTRDGATQWQNLVPMGLHGKILGIVGVGNLGVKTAEIAKAFKMRVIGWSPNLTPERAASAGVEFCSSKEELLKYSDVVSIHMKLTERTVNLIHANDFSVMKPTAIFINTSRGPLVNESALVEALNAGKIAGAGLDVFDVEPLPLDHPLRKARNVTLSPHLGYVSDSNYATFWGQTVENIQGFLDGKPVRVI